MVEQCECCGRFGAIKGKYANISNPLYGDMITLYLCPRCDVAQRTYDIERMEAQRDRHDRTLVDTRGEYVTAQVPDGGR